MTTICALSTPPGESALAVVRVSGDICERLVTKTTQRPALPSPRRQFLANYVSVTGHVLDTCLVSYFEKNASYTGEPMLEYSLHGNPLVVQLVIQDLIAQGCVQAEPGEFTRRAFLNGKMDLAQAEAVADLIHARSQRALEAAHRHLRGELGHTISQLTDQLLQIVAEVEAYLDFPEEDLPDENTAGPMQRLVKLSAELRYLAETSRYRKLLTDGIPVTIAGAPNAGKSSLLNALLGESRALVAAQPGTTRDYLSERIMIAPYALRLVDTAGLHTTDDAIEQAGIARSLQKIDEAELILLVVDSADALPDYPKPLLDALASKRAIVVESKADLADSKSMASHFPELMHVRMAITERQGLESLKTVIRQILETQAILPDPEQLMVNTRHAQALEAAAGAIEAAVALHAEAAPAELMAAELRAAMEQLGEVVGRIDNEAMLDRLFASFCIGK